MLTLDRPSYFSLCVFLSHSISFAYLSRSRCSGLCLGRVSSAVCWDSVELWSWPYTHADTHTMVKKNNNNKNTSAWTAYALQVSEDITVRNYLLMATSKPTGMILWWSKKHRQLVWTNIPLQSVFHPCKGIRATLLKHWHTCFAFSNRTACFLTFLPHADTSNLWLDFTSSSYRAVFRVEWSASVRRTKCTC